MTTDNIPKSRLTLTYQMKVNGKTKDVELPFRMVVLGDLSGKTTDRGELDQRKIRRLDGKNLSKVMESMNISTTVKVPNRIGHTDATELDFTLKFKDIDAFTPEAVSDQIPPVKALKLLKALLTEAQSNLDNSKTFRNLIRQLPANKDELKKSLTGFSHFEIAKLRGLNPVSGAAQQQGQAQQQGKAQQQGQAQPQGQGQQGGTNG